MSRRKEREMQRRGRRFLQAGKRAVVSALGLAVPIPMLVNELEESDVSETASLLPPGKGWRLIAKRTFTGGGMHYPRGSTVPISEIEDARNIQALFDDRLQWVPPSAPPGPEPRPIVVELEPKRPTKDQVAALLAEPRPSDAVKAWRELFAAMCKLTGGNAALAEDILLGDEATARLARAALRIDAEVRGQGTYRRVVRPLREVGI